MKAITVKQPWASLIVEGIKDVENRTWPTKFRGRVLIHASLDKKLMNVPPNTFMTDDMLCFVMNKNIKFSLRDYELYGAIIGSVEIVDCVIDHQSVWAEKSYFNVTSNPLPLEEENEQDYIVYNWILANPIKFDKPIPAKGKLSFWEFADEQLPEIK